MVVGVGVEIVFLPVHLRNPLVPLPIFKKTFNLFYMLNLLKKHDTPVSSSVLLHIMKYMPLCMDYNSLYIYIYMYILK